jgi:hypothetical protein
LSLLQQSVSRPHPVLVFYHRHSRTTEHTLLLTLILLPYGL